MDYRGRVDRFERCFRFAVDDENGRQREVVMNLTQDQEKQVLQIVRETPWGDVEGALETIDEGLSIAMRASQEEFLHWEENADRAGFPDEFSIVDIADLSPEWRHALIARLLRSIAMAYGVGTDYARDAIGEVNLDRTAAVTPVRELLAAIARGSHQDEPANERHADLGDWTGDVEELRGQEDRLATDEDLCNRVFASKSEAFTTGLALAHGTAQAEGASV
jgi:hypothetical protein